MRAAIEHTPNDIVQQIQPDINALVTHRNATTTIFVHNNSARSAAVTRSKRWLVMVRYSRTTAIRLRSHRAAMRSSKTRIIIIATGNNSHRAFLRVPAPPPPPPPHHRVSFVHRINNNRRVHCIIVVRVAHRQKIQRHATTLVAYDDLGK